jgi:hypothetical protein
MEQYDITVIIRVTVHNKQEADLVADQYSKMALSYKSIGAETSSVVSVNEIQAKYFVDQDGRIRSTLERLFGCELYINSLNKMVDIVCVDTQEVLDSFYLHDSLEALESLGVDTTEYKLNKEIQNG